MINLSQHPFFFMDCQTSGFSPKTSYIIEAGWSWTSVEQMSEDGASCHPFQTLVQLPRDQKLSTRITRITGISEQEVHQGLSQKKLWRTLRLELLDFDHPSLQAIYCIAHAAHFEKNFLDVLWNKYGGSEFPATFICTQKIARKLFPGLSSYSLKSVLAFLNKDLQTYKRSMDHVQATQQLWCEIVAELQRQYGIESLEGLHSWLNTGPAPKKVAGKSYQRIHSFFDRQQRLQLPEQPGVYFFKNASNEIIYVGKATSLKSRVNSYFRQRRGLGARKNEMLLQVRDISFEVTTTPLEAALREIDLIRTLRPYYNEEYNHEDHPVWFCTREFSSTREVLDQLHCIGPFKNLESLHFVEALRLFLHAGEEHFSNLLTFLHYDDELDQDTQDVVMYFRSSLRLTDLQSLSQRGLIALGLWSWRKREKEKRLALALQETGKEEDLHDHGDGLTEVTLTDVLMSQLRQSARAYWRAKRLADVMNTVLAYQWAGQVYEYDLRDCLNGSDWTYYQLQKVQVIRRHCIKEKVK